jgi:hypothetical protein
MMKMMLSAVEVNSQMDSTLISKLTNGDSNLPSLAICNSTKKMILLKKKEKD